MPVHNICCIHTRRDFSSVRCGGALRYNNGRGGHRALRPVYVRLRGGRYRRERIVAHYERLDPRGGSERRQEYFHEVSEALFRSCC